MQMCQQHQTIRSIFRFYLTVNQLKIYRNTDNSSNMFQLLVQVIKGIIQKNLQIKIEDRMYKVVFVQCDLTCPQYQTIEESMLTGVKYFDSFGIENAYDYPFLMSPTQVELRYKMIHLFSVIKVQNIIAISIDQSYSSGILYKPNNT